MAAALSDARVAAQGDNAALAAAQARVWTALVHAGLLGAVADARRGDAAAARHWLLVREYRPPTRFTRASTDATLAVARLARGDLKPAAAARAVRADLLDTYEARLRTTLQSARAAARRGFDVRLVEAASLARGYARILAGSYRSQRGPQASARLDAALAQLERRALAGDRTGVASAVGAVERQLEGFRAAPLAPAEQARRAGQLDRFLRLVPIEYDRGVEGSRVTVPFEIQEAISFRAAAEAALADIAPTLLQRDATATRELTVIVASLGNALDNAAGGRAVAPAEQVSAQTRALARPDRRALSRGVEGGSRGRRLRRDRGLAQPARERRRGRQLEPSRAGAAGGVRDLRARPGAAASRHRSVSVPAHRRIVLVRRRRSRGARPAREDGRTPARSSRLPWQRSTPSSPKRLNASGRERARPRPSSRTARSSSFAKGSRRC